MRKLCLVLLLACSTNVYAVPQWLGLFHWDLIAWLDNPHRQKDMCPDSKPECLAKAKKEKVLTLELYAEPDKNSTLIGNLVIIALPGKGLHHAFKPVGKEAKTFKPDWYDSAWTYGPFYHQSITAQQEQWFQLPPNPFPQAVWLDATPLKGKRGFPVATLDDHKVYLLDGEGVVIEQIEEDSVTLRPEQPIDMPCEGDEDPLEEGTEKHIPYADILDTDGHFKLKPKYMRGC